MLFRSTLTIVLAGAVSVVSARAADEAARPRAVVELFIYVGVTIAWWSMGQALIGTALALVAVVAGVLSGRRALA